jgi:hypothetical protein
LVLHLLLQVIPKETCFGQDPKEHQMRLLQDLEWMEHQMQKLVGWQRQVPDLGKRKQMHQKQVLVELRKLMRGL